MKPLLLILLLASCSAASPPSARQTDERASPPAAPIPAPRAASAASADATGTPPSETDAANATDPAAAAIPAPKPAAAVDDAPAVDDLDTLAAELRTLSPDPAPERTTNDTHYLVSNERRHDLFSAQLSDRGGVMLGVGSDQNYVMAPWAGIELLVIVDFDDKIVDLHTIHGALMGAAPTVDEFRRLWSDEGLDDARAVLRDAFPPRRRGVLLALLDEAQPAVHKRLRTLARRFEELGVHSYLDTPEQYRFIADLHARGRVVAIRGDFTKDGLLRDIATTLDAHETPLSVLYLSNIEQYFSYRKPFKANMLALPIDDETAVLRTLPGRPAGFHYIAQHGEDFHAWMRAPKIWSVYRIVGLGRGEHLSAGEVFIAGPPPTGS